MKRRHRHHPIIWMLERLSGNRVRLFFSTGRIVEIPVVSSARAKIVERGLGLDPGDGFDRCAVELHKAHGKVWAKGHWV